MRPEFEAFPKISRLRRGCCITEKIDGTNAAVVITEESLAAGELYTQSRSRYITPEDDNYGFARWAEEHKQELLGLGVGRHFGEWWGNGIQRKYGLTEKRFSLFNVARWADGRQPRPACCNVVPTLYWGEFDTRKVNDAIDQLRVGGSVAAPGFMSPEGIVVWHDAARLLFKMTIEKDEEPKSKVAA